MARVKVSPTTLQMIRAAVGTALCAALAALSVLLFSGNAHKSWLPILFISVLLVASLRFGALSGVIGGIAAALIFAAFLFSPLGTIRVEAEEARNNLGWMLLVGIPASYFAAATRDDVNLKKR
jgi:K+-sensing histidine kinase KdpD